MLKPDAVRIGLASPLHLHAGACTCLRTDMWIDMCVVDIRDSGLEGTSQRGGEGARKRSKDSDAKGERARRGEARRGEAKQSEGATDRPTDRLTV